MWTICNKLRNHRGQIYHTLIVSRQTVNKVNVNTIANFNLQLQLEYNKKKQNNPITMF